MKKYHAKYWWHPRIDKIDVDKETDVSVWVDGNRRKKVSDGEGFFDSFDEAKEHIVRCLEAKARSAEAYAVNCRKKADAAKIMEEE